MAAHLEPAYADVTPGPLPVTERLTRDSLILPLHHDLGADDQEYIVDVLRGPARA
jgi:perosamine synthetase